MTDTAGTTGLPPGWEWCPRKTEFDKSCVVTKPLESFQYLEIHYEPGSPHDHDYALYRVNVDGPYQREMKGRFNSLEKALREGDRL